MKFKSLFKRLLVPVVILLSYLFACFVTNGKIVTDGDVSRYVNFDYRRFYVWNDKIGLGSPQWVKNNANFLVSSKNLCSENSHRLQVSFLSLLCGFI